MIFEYLKKLALDLLFPKRCIECGEYGNFICYECLRGFSFLEEQECPNCRRKKNQFGFFCNEQCHEGFYFDQLIVCSSYSKNLLIRKLITNFKYKFVKDLSFVLAEALRTQFVYTSQFIPEFSKAILVPVPIHKKRLLYRGFHQTKLLTENLLFYLKNDPDFENKFENVDSSDCLIRKKFLIGQAKLKRHERLENLTGAIEFDKKFRDGIKNKFLILIDDVATTCTTINECSKVLKQFGARHICGLVLARGQ
jgi:ComF family protein